MGHTSSSTTTALQAECREFARQFPTPNVLKAVRYAETGVVSWSDIHEIFRQSLAAGLAEVRG